MKYELTIYASDGALIETVQFRNKKKGKSYLKGIKYIFETYHVFNLVKEEEDDF